MSDEGTLSDAAGPSDLPVSAEPRKARKTAPRSEVRWSSYILKVLKEVHPDLQINKAGVTVLSDALDDLMERLAKECKHLVQSNERATLTARDVEAAVRLLIPPGAIRDLATKQGSEAVARADSIKKS